jgi:sugar lactone lactonase YvrE
VDGRTGIVSTVLGGVSVGDGGLATNAFITGPNGIAAGSDGTLYLADLWGQRIRAVDMETWRIRTVAGNGVRFYGGDGGAAVEAYLANPHDVAQGPEGEIYIADTRYNRIRRVDPSGSISTHVGTGMSYDSGDGGPSVSAAMTAPLSVTVSAEGAVYLGDSVGRIRRVDPSTGVIDTVAGTGRPGYGGDGGPATSASISGPSALALDSDGNLYFADTGNHAIRCVGLDGRMRTVVGTGHPGRAHDGARPRAVRARAWCCWRWRRPAPEHRT